MSEKQVSSPGIAAKMLVAPATSVKGADVCLFVAYCPDGKVGPGLQYFLQKFIEQDIKVVLCLIVEDEAVTVNVADLTMCSSIVVRKNTGYDFGAWAGTLRTLPQLWEAKRLFFVNDSILGPNQNFGSLISNIRASSEDFIALTANWIDVYHAQSYFYVYQSNALQNETIRKSWDDLPDFPSKLDVIRECEQRQLRLICECGLNHRIMFPLNEKTAFLSAAEKDSFNPTHHAWGELVANGFPFLKADLFYRSKQNLSGWNRSFDHDVIRLQLDVILSSRVSRASTEVRAQHTSLKFLKKLIGEERFFRFRSQWKAWRSRQRVRKMSSHFER